MRGNLAAFRGRRSRTGHARKPPCPERGNSSREQPVVGEEGAVLEGAEHLQNTALLRAETA